MKVVSTEGLTKLIQLVKSAFVKVEDVVETQEVTLADVALSGDYDDLINKPTIPTATSDLTNDSGFITSSALAPYVLSSSLATVATSGSYNDLTNKPTIPTVNNPTITFTQGGTTKGSFTLNQPTNQTVAFDAGGNARNIGEIIQSTIPLTDAGLHLLDGSLIQGDGIYSEFYDFMVEKWQTYPQIFAGEQDWQNHVATYGVCGKFVLDEFNRTIRLPLITGFIEGTNDYNALGALTGAGLPNITGSFSVISSADDLWKTNVGTSGAFYPITALSGKQWYAQAISNNTTDTNDAGFNASRSSSIYGNSSTVQPQSIKVLYYIVIATSTKTDIQVDIDEIVTDLNNKLDKNDLAPVHCVIETYQNGTSWYRVYDDGWCEQGGKFVITSASVGSGSYNTATLTFIKPFTKCITYNVQAKHDRFNAGFSTEVNGQALSQVEVYQVNDSTGSFVNPFVIWTACGYIS